MSTTFIQLNSGILVDYTHPEKACFTWKDLALGMATTHRFLGQLNRPLNLAEHSIRVAELVPCGFRLDALLHDVGEVFVGDIPAPLKRFLADRGETSLVELEEKFERRVRTVLQTRYKLSPQDFPGEMSEQSKQAVHRADLIACRLEAEAGFDSIAENWTEALPEVSHRSPKYGAAGYVLSNCDASDRPLTRSEWARWWLWEIQKCLPLGNLLLKQVDPDIDAGKLVWYERRDFFEFRSLKIDEWAFLEENPCDPLV